MTGTAPQVVVRPPELQESAVAESPSRAVRTADRVQAAITERSRVERIV